MLRMTALTVAMLTLAASGALAREHSDVANNFRVSIPDGWTSETPISRAIKLKIRSPRAAETRGMCSVITKLIPETKTVSQADIDADGDKTVDEAFWLKGLKKVTAVEDVTIEAHGAKMINGHKAYFVLANITGTIPNVGPVNAKMQQMIEAIPGQLFIVTCTATIAAYAQEESDFDSVFASFAPLSDVPVASLSSPGVRSLTMYSLPQFGGVSRVFTQDTPSVGAYGWRTTTASVSIAGSGAWEVCDGANFTGRCHTITAAMPTGPNGKIFAIASARHVKAILPPQAGPGDISDALAASVEGLLTR
jgi:hypothetical protein